MQGGGGRSATSMSSEEMDPEKSLLNYLDVLDPSALEAMEVDFDEVEEREGRGLTQVEFVGVMKKHIPPELFDMSMATALCDLFDQIDINGDEELEWEEFTGFLATGVNQSDSSDNARVDLFGMSKVHDIGGAIFPDGIERVFYIASADKNLVCGNGQSSVKVFDAGSGRVTHTLSGHRKDVLAVTDIGEMGNDRHCFATSSADRTVKFWDSKTLRLHAGIGKGGTIETSEVTLSLCWLPVRQEAQPDNPYKSIVRKYEMADENPARISRTQDLGIALPVLPNFPVYTAAALGLSTSPRKQLAKRKGLDKPPPPPSRLSPRKAPRKKKTGADDDLEELYRGEYGLLAAGSTTGVIDLWDVDSSSVVATLDGHQRMAAMDIIYAGSPEYLISGGLDKTVRLWDVRRGVASGKLEGHKKGVTCLSYSPEYKVIFSAGYDPYPLVWNPYVGSNFRFSLKGHSCSLVGVHVIPGTPEVITADADGIFKLWDMRNFMCIQTFQDESFEGVLRSFAYSAPHNRIVASAAKNKPDMETTSASMLTRAPVAARVIKKAKKGQAMTVQHIHADRNVAGVLPPYHERLHYFDQEIFDSLGDSKERTIGALWIDTNLTFLTVTNSGFQVWDSMSGSMKKNFSKVVQDGCQITCFCLDNRKRKLFVGDDRGGIFVFDTMKGSVIEELQPHLKEISGVAFSADANALITSSWDATMRMYDSSSSEAMMITREMTGHGADISAMTVCESMAKIASGDIAGRIRVWDISQARRPLLLFERKRTATNGWMHSTEIVALCFLPHMNGLASSDSEGKVLVWSLDSKKPIGGFWNDAMVTSMIVVKSEHIVITGDDQGVIKYWKVDGAALASAAKNKEADSPLTRQRSKLSKNMLKKVSMAGSKQRQADEVGEDSPRSSVSPTKSRREGGGKGRRRASTLFKIEGKNAEVSGNAKNRMVVSKDDSMRSLAASFKEAHDDIVGEGAKGGGEGREGGGAAARVPPLQLPTSLASHLSSTTTNSNTAAAPTTTSSAFFAPSGPAPPTTRPPSSYSRRGLSTGRSGADSRSSSRGRARTGMEGDNAERRSLSSRQNTAGRRGMGSRDTHLRRSMGEDGVSSDEEEETRGHALWTTLFSKSKGVGRAVRTLVRQMSNIAAQGTFLTEIEEGGDEPKNGQFLQNVPLLLNYSAHSTDIVSIEVIDEPKSLLTCSSDRSCCVWAFQSSSLLGELAFDKKGARRMRRVWAFNAPWDKVSQTRRSHTARVLRRVAGKVSEVYDPELEGVSQREHMSKYLRSMYEDKLNTARGVTGERKRRGEEEGEGEGEREGGAATARPDMYAGEKKARRGSASGLHADIGGGGGSTSLPPLA